MGANCPHVHWEQELVRRAQRRERDAVDRLIARYTPLVEARVRTYGREGPDREDLLQEGMVTLFAAIHRYDEDRSKGFAAFAEICIRRRLITILQGESRTRGVPLCRVAESVPAATVHDPALSLIGLQLSDLERRVVIALGEGFTYHEISTHLGCTVKRVDNAMQRVRRKCQALVQPEG